MRAGPWAPALLVALLTLTGFAVPAAPAAAQSDGTPPPDRTVVTIQITADGDARWTITTYFEIDSESDRDAFRSLADQFESGTAEVTYGLDTFREAVERADAETSRSMELDQSERSSATVNGTGQLALTFRWTNFASVEDDRLLIGDVFKTTNPWLPGLADEQRLVVRPPANYGIFQVPDEPTIEQGNVVYEGPITFEEGDLEIVFERRASLSPTTSGSTSDPPPGNGGFDLSGPLVFGLLAVGLGAIALGAYLRSDDEGRSDQSPDGPEAPAGSAETAADAEEEKEEGEVDLALLSDEERVEHLLEQNGGRMKQANIVKETGWSNAKVSQLLSGMAEEGRINKLRIGRENLISLPDEEVTSIDDEE